jgi:hypothetical protein
MQTTTRGLAIADTSTALLLLMRTAKALQSDTGHERKYQCHYDRPDYE